MTKKELSAKIKALSKEAKEEFPEAAAVLTALSKTVLTTKDRDMRLFMDDLDERTLDAWLS